MYISQPVEERFTINTKQVCIFKYSQEQATVGIELAIIAITE